MNHFTQHIPNCVDTDSRQEFDFDTLDELVAKIPKPDGKLVIDGKKPPYYIMTVSDDERWWWVLGRVDEKVDLPEWKGDFYTVRDEQGNEFEIRSGDIEWYDGTIGELKDGRKVKFK